MRKPNVNDLLYYGEIVLFNNDISDVFILLEGSRHPMHGKFPCVEWESKAKCYPHIRDIIRMSWEFSDKCLDSDDYSRVEVWGTPVEFAEDLFWRLLRASTQDTDRHCRFRAILDIGVRRKGRYKGLWHLHDLDSGQVTEYHLVKRDWRQSSLNKLWSNQ